MRQPRRWVSSSNEGRPRSRHAAYDHHSGSHRLAVRREHSANHLNYALAGHEQVAAKGLSERGECRIAPLPLALVDVDQLVELRLHLVQKHRKRVDTTLRLRPLEAASLRRERHFQPDTSTSRTFYFDIYFGHFDWRSVFAARHASAHLVQLSISFSRGLKAQHQLKRLGEL